MCDRERAECVIESVIERVIERVKCVTERASQVGGEWTAEIDFLEVPPQTPNPKL